MARTRVHRGGTALVIHEKADDMKTDPAARPAPDRVRPDQEMIGN